MIAMYVQSSTSFHELEVKGSSTSPDFTAARLIGASWRISR